MCRCGHSRHGHSAVLKWSLECLFRNTWPDLGMIVLHGHQKTENARTAMATWVVHGLLAPARGEWAGYKKVFYFSSWSSDQICWRCETNTSHTRCTDSSSNVLWKNISRVSPVSVSNCSCGMVVIGAPHSLDLGVSQHIVGNICREALDLFPPARSVGRVLII